jgi:nudix-type nucleoside diphosphatase (YffH/AdpP family)
LQIQRSEVLHEGRSKFYLLTVGVGDGKTREHMMQEQRDGACVLPYDPVNKTAVLVRQERVSVAFVGRSERLTEVPAGGVEDEDDEVCAKREALEEAGLRLRDIEFVARLWPDPGCLSTRISVYLAEISPEDRVADGGGLQQENEFIEVVELPLSDLARMTDAGEISDMKSFAAVQTLRLRRPDLFS